MFRPFTRLLLCLCLLLCGRIQARVSVIDANGGLPDKFITDICKDRHGLMWIGTKQGICTYDGYDFVPVTAPVLSGVPVIRLLYVIADDILWAATEKGLYKIHCADQHVTFIDNKMPWCRLPVTALTLGNKGRIYAAYTTGRITTVSPGGQLLLLAQVPRSVIILQYLTRSHQSEKPALQVSGSDVFYQFSLKNDSLLELNRQSAAIGIIALQGDTVVTEHNGLRFIKGISDTDITPSAIKTQQVANTTNVYFKNNIAYILCRPSYLFRADLTTNRVTAIQSDAFTGRLSTCMYFDKENIIWVGTNKGLLKISPDNTVFEHSLLESPTISIRPLVIDEHNNMYAGTYSGFYKRDHHSNTWQRKIDFIPYAMVNMPGSYIYMAGEQKELSRFNKHTEAIETNFYKKEGLSADELRNTYAMMADGQGKIWTGGSYGLAYYDPATNLLSGIKNIKWPDGLPIVRYLRDAGNGALWLCTNKGLYLLNKEQQIIWYTTTHTRPALSNNTINYIDEDRQGRLWVCTVGGGINIISKDRRAVTVLKTDDGLSDNLTYMLLWGRDGRAWISTYNGLSTYDTIQKIFYNYYTTEGLTSNEFNHNAFFKDSTGKIYLGTINGLNAFYPDSLYRHIKPATLFASTITKWDNNTRAMKLIPASNTAVPIILNPMDHSLSFSLALSDYSFPDNNLYHYRLRGLFDEWIPLSSPHTLRLDGMAAGTYMLEIMALDGRGVPAQNILRYKIQVKQAFYKAWWFYLLLFLLTSGLAWSFFYLRLRHLRRVQSLREQIASDLHDEVGSLLTRITMTSDNLLYNNKSTLQEQSSGLQKIAALSRTAVSSMSDILWTIDARNDYTGNLADRMREHAEEMLLPMHIELSFDFQVDSRKSISSGLRQQLYLILKEAVNNIARHSKATKVNIRYHHEDNGFELNIANNGATDRAISAKSQGLKNMEMRAKRIHAKSVTGRNGDMFQVKITGN